MTFRHTQSFGKRMEYNIIGEMLIEGLDVYLPMIDDHGVDCIVKKSDGTFVEIQIKARSKEAKQPNCFTVDGHESPLKNFYFIFYSDLLKKMWVFNSEEFINNSSVQKSGKHAGRRKIYLFNKKRERQVVKFTSFVKDDYSFLK